MLYEGKCHGGPLDGQDAISRHPLGFILVDKRAQQVWIYDWAGGGFFARDRLPTPLITDPDEADNIRRAAAEPDYDVLAAPWVDAEEADL